MAGPEWHAKLKRKGDVVIITYFYLILVCWGKLSWVLRDEGGYRNVNKVILHWKNGFYDWQLKLVVPALDGEHMMYCLTTGRGKSALFAVPMIIFLVISKNPELYPNLPYHMHPVGLVMMPTKGLTCNIVRPRSSHLLLNGWTDDPPRLKNWAFLMFLHLCTAMTQSPKLAKLVANWLQKSRNVRPGTYLQITWGYPQSK